MTKTIYEWFGREGGYIRVRILHKVPKGEYKIRLELRNSVTGKKSNIIMTPLEAVIVSNALLSAFTMLGDKRRHLR